MSTSNTLLNACFADDPVKIREALAAGEPVSFREVERASSLLRRHAVENLQLLWAAWQKAAETSTEAADELRQARVKLVNGWAFQAQMNPQQNWNYTARSRAGAMAKIVFTGAAHDPQCFKAVADFPDGTMLKAMMEANGLKSLTLEQLRGVLGRVRVTGEWVPVVVGAVAQAPDTVVADFLHRSMDDPAATVALLEFPRCREALVRRPEFYLKCAASLGHQASVEHMLDVLASEGVGLDERQTLAIALIRSIWNREMLRDDDSALQAQAGIVAMLGRTTGCRLDGERFDGRRDSRLAGLMQSLALLGADVPDLQVCEVAARLREAVQTEANRSGFETESESQLVFSTRDEGDIAAGRAGRADIVRGGALAERISEIVGQPIVPEVVDEWVLVSVPESVLFESAEKVVAASISRSRVSGMTL